MGNKLAITLRHTGFYNFLSTYFELWRAQISKLTKSRFPEPQRFQDGAKESYGCKRKGGKIGQRIFKEGKQEQGNSSATWKTVRWVHKWCNSGILILTDKRRSGRPLKLSQADTATKTALMKSKTCFRCN